MQENIVKNVNLKLLNKVLLVLRQKKAGKKMIKDLNNFIYLFKETARAFHEAYPEVDPANPGYKFVPKKFLDLSGNK
jgi:hypothetical protein